MARNHQRTNRFRTLALLPVGCLLVASAAEAQRPFKSSDAIEVTKLYDTRIVGHSMNRTPFLLSPDSSLLLFITGKGDSQRSTYDFKLQMYKTAEVLGYLRGERPLPRPTVVLQKDYNQAARFFSIWSTGGIKQVSISEDLSSILHISPDDHGVYQLYRTDLHDSASTQLTRSDTHVIDYVRVPGRDELLYTTAARVPPEDPNCSKLGYVVGKKPLFSMFCLPNGMSARDFEASREPFPTKVSVYRLPLSGDHPAVQVANAITLTKRLSESLFSVAGNRAVLELSTFNPPPAVQAIYQQTPHYLESFAQPDNGSGFDGEVMAPRYPYEPRRVCRRLFGLCHAAIGRCSIIA